MCLKYHQGCFLLRTDRLRQFVFKLHVTSHFSFVNYHTNTPGNAFLSGQTEGRLITDRSIMPKLFKVGLKIAHNTHIMLFCSFNSPRIIGKKIS